MSAKLNAGQRKRAQELYASICEDGDAIEDVLYDHIAALDSITAQAAEIARLNADLTQAFVVIGEHEAEIAQLKSRVAEVGKERDAWKTTSDALSTRNMALATERDSFQRIGKHYEGVLAKAADLLNPGGTGRTAALVVCQDLPKVIATLATTQAQLRRVVTVARALLPIRYENVPPGSNGAGWNALQEDTSLTALEPEETP